MPKVCGLTGCHDELVSQVRARAVRWVSDEPFPGWVEVHLDLADGTVAKLFDKPPVFTADDERLRAGASYPVDLELACDVCAAEGGTAAGADSVYVTLLHGVSGQSGEVTFLVRDRDVIPGG
jgi:hypothetical protein